MKTDAQALAEFGYHILPIAAGRKYPPLTDNQAWDDATNQPDLIDQWWTAYPDANIAWSPGKTGNTLIDIDGPEGIQTLKNLGVQFDPDRPHTITIATPGRGGGWHLIYQKPDLPDLTKGKLGPGLEHITNNQYALLPPSRTPDGEYRWHKLVTDTPPLPPQLQELIANGKPHHNHINPDPADPDCRYCPARADGIISDIANTPEGSRNDNLFYKTRCLLELPDINHQHYLQQAEKAAHQTGLTPHETNTTIHSALKQHTLKYGTPGNGPGCQANYKRTPQPTEPPPPPPTPQPGQWMTRLINTIQAKPQTWLIDQWIPLEATTLLYGDSDKGKSTLLLTWAAQISNQQKLHTIYCTGDIDNPETSIKPKWTAAGGHPYGLSVLEDRTQDQNGNPVTPTYIQTLHHIENLIENTQAQLTHHQAEIRKVGLVILDPIENFLPPDINTHNNMQVKQALEPLSRIAQHKQCSIIFVQHLNKNQGASAKNRASGSTSFMSYVRSGICLGLNPNNYDQRAIKIVKANLTPGTRKPCQIYKMENRTWTEPQPGGWETTISAPRMTFVQDAPHITATEILAADPEAPKKELDTQETLELILNTLDTEEVLWADQLRDILEKHHKVSRRKYYQALDLAKNRNQIIEGRQPPQRGKYYLMSNLVPEDLREQVLQTLT